MQQEGFNGNCQLVAVLQAALVCVPYFGVKGVEKYGLEILSIVRRYMKENKLGQSRNLG